LCGICAPFTTLQKKKKKKRKPGHRL